MRRRPASYYTDAAIEAATELLDAGGGHPSEIQHARRLARLAGVSLNDLVDALRD